MIIQGCMHSEFTCKPLDVSCSLFHTNTLDNLSDHKGHSSLHALIGVLLEGCGRHSADMHWQVVSNMAVADLPDRFTNLNLRRLAWVPACPSPPRTSFRKVSTAWGVVHVEQMCSAP